MPRIRFNVRLFAILLLLGIVAGVGFFLVHRFQAGRQVEARLTQARRYAKQAEEQTDPTQRYELIREAIQSYQRYLRVRPEEIDISVELATFSIDQGEWIVENGTLADAFPLFGLSRSLLESALRQEEGRTDVRRQFVEILFNLGDYSTAMQHIRFLCVMPKDQKELQDLFDRYDLWEKAVASGKIEAKASEERDLSRFLKHDKKTVDEEQLLDFLGEDLWVVIEDPELLGILGHCQFNTNNPKYAIKSLEQSILRRSDNLDVYDTLVKALRLQGRSDDAKYWLEEVVKANPDMFRAYLIRGQDRLYQANAVSQEEAPNVLARAEWDALTAAQKAAQELLESAYQIIPDAEITTSLKQDFDKAMDLAPASNEAITKPYQEALLQAITHVGPAVELMEKTLSQKESKKITQDPKSEEVVSSEKMIQKDLEGCRDGLLLAVECETQKSLLDPKNSEEHIQSAREVAETVLNMFPKDDKVYLTLADIELQAGNSEGMIDWMIRGAQNAKENTVLLWRLGTALATIGQTKEARDILEQLEASNAKKMMIKHLQAALAMSEANWSIAAKHLEEIRPEFVSTPIELRKIDILLAQCYEKLGRLNDQREAFARAASFDRTWGPALIGLAQSRAAAGQYDEAIKDYQVILELPDVSPERYFEYARLLLLSATKKPKLERNLKSVEDAIQQAAIAMPNSPLIPMLQAELLIVEGEPEKARQLLTSLHDKIGEAKEKVLQKRKTVLDEAQSLTGSNRVAKLEEAKNLLTLAQSYDVQQPQVWAKLVSLAAQQGDWEAADQAFQEAEAKLGDTPTVRWLQAQRLFRKSGKDVAAGLHVLAENTDKFDRTEKLNLLRRLAVVAGQMDDFSQAEKLAEKVLQEEPSDVEMQKVLFHVARNKKDFAAMETMLNRLRKTEGTASAFWHYGEAIRLYMLAQEAKNPQLIQDAMNLLSQASRMEPRWSAPTLLLAQIFQEQGKLSEATDLYMNAVRNGEQNPGVVRKVANLLTQQRRYQEADEMFGLLSQFRNDSMQDTGISASYVKAQLGDFSQAVSMAREACTNSDKYQDFLWLGRVLTVSAKRADEENQDAESKKLYDEAEQAFLKATKLESSAPDAWIGLIQFYGLFDKKQEAVNAVEQAKEAISADEVDLSLAQAYETLGEVKKAAMHYRKAIRNLPKDMNVARMATTFFLKNGFADESKMLLKRIVDKQVDANEEQIAWAKRMLGVVLVRENGSGDITETIKLLDENLKANPNSVPDLYAKASLLASDPTGLHQEEAIELLERIQTQQRTPGVAIQHELADLYYATNRWNDFKETMRNVLAGEGDQPQVLGKYVLRLSQRGEYNEANVWMQRLKEIAPNDTATFFVECDLAYEQKQYEDLLKMINVWAEQEDQGLDRKKRLGNATSLCQRYAVRLHGENKESLAQKFEQQAESSLLEYIELEPQAKLDLAVLYAQQSQFEKSVLALNEIAEANNPSLVGVAVYKILTEGELPENQIQQVQKILQRVSDRAPDEVFLKMMLAFCEEQQGQPDQAETMLREILRQNPDNVDVTNYLAVTLALREKNLEEARTLIDKAIKTAGPLPDLLDSRAIVLLAQKQPQAAINDLRQAIARKPSGSFYFHLAEALQQQGLKKPAVNALDTAKKLGFREATLSPTERRNYRRLQLSLQ